MPDEDPMQLQDAAFELQAIRLHLARAERLRSVGALTAAVAAAGSLLAGFAQWACVQNPLAEPHAWIMLWTGTAAACGVFAIGESVRPTCMGKNGPDRARQPASARSLTWFAPSVVPGAVLTWLIGARLPGHLWLLPGLWQLLFGLGCFAAWRRLPPATWIVGAFFLASGTTCLFLQQAALGPLAMAGPFTLGLGVLAAILRHHEAPRQTP